MANLVSTSATDTKPAVRYGIPGLWWKLWTGVWMALLSPAALLFVGPASGFPYPPGARLIMFHVPCAWLSTLAYIVGAWYAARYLIAAGRGYRYRHLEDDYKCAAAMEQGILFSVLTTVSGSIFSHLEWGKYWNWDPRQTSILIILLIFAAYVVLRGTIDDPETRARLCSAYALVAMVPGLFLIWVLPRIVPTLHEGANQAIIGGNVGGNYRYVLYGIALPAFVALFTWLLQLRVRMMKFEARKLEAG